MPALLPADARPAEAYLWSMADPLPEVPYSFGVLRKTFGCGSSDGMSAGAMRGCFITTRAMLTTARRPSAARVAAPTVQSRSMNLAKTPG